MELSKEDLPSPWTPRVSKESVVIAENTESLEMFCNNEEACKDIQIYSNGSYSNDRFIFANVKESMSGGSIHVRDADLVEVYCYGEESCEGIEINVSHIRYVSFFLGAWRLDKGARVPPPNTFLDTLGVHGEGKSSIIWRRPRLLATK